MKRFRILVVLFVLISSTTLLAQTIAGSAHDFSSETWSGGKICVVCHTPHNADATVSDAPLWNHDVTSSTFTLYSTGTLDATLGQPASSSKLCLSCHDGTVALDSFGGNTGSSTISGTTELGTDLSNDHPVSFTYNTALATSDGELEDPATNSTVSGLLFSGNLECASCHDVHNATGFGKFLRINNAGSALCLTCHVK